MTIVCVCTAGFNLWFVAVCCVGSGHVCRVIASIQPSRSVEINFGRHSKSFSQRDLEFLPGKRALAIGLCIYHVTCSTVLYNAPRFIPHSFGSFAEAYVFAVCKYLSPWLICPLGITSPPSMYGAPSTDWSDWALLSGGKPPSN